jgi:hypothetical protein
MLLLDGRSIRKADIGGADGMEKNAIRKGNVLKIQGLSPGPE